MDVGKSQKRSGGRRKTALVVIAGIVILFVAIGLGIHLINNSSPEASAPQSKIVLVYEDESEAGHCEGPQVEPSEIKLGCGKFPLTDLHWSNWGSAAATASGTAHLNDCRPDCAEGTFREFPITIVLTRISTCKETGERRYENLNVTYLSGKHPDFISTYPCPLTKAQEKSNANAQLIAELAIKAKGATIDPEQVYVHRSSRDREWVKVTGTTSVEPVLSWTVDLKSTDGEWAVRYAGFDEEDEYGNEHYVDGLPCDLDFSGGSPSC